MIKHFWNIFSAIILAVIIVLASFGVFSVCQLFRNKTSQTQTLSTPESTPMMICFEWLDGTWKCHKVQVKEIDGGTE